MLKDVLQVHFCIHFQKASSSFAPAEHACLEQPKPNLVQRSPVFCCYKLGSIQHSNGRCRVRPALCTTACLKPGEYVSTLMVFFFFFTWMIGENEESGRYCEGSFAIPWCCAWIHRLAPFCKGRAAPLVRFIWRYINHTEKAGQNQCKIS